MKRLKWVVMLALWLVLSHSATAWAICGDGILEASETCDDNNTAAGDGCDATCNVETGYQCNTDLLCGNNTVDPGEQCDDGNTTSGDGCSDQCAIEIDLTNFIKEPFLGAVNALNVPQWNVSADGRSVTLPNNINPKPGYFISDDEIFSSGTSRTIDVQFSGSTDDDYVGLVFGFKPGDWTNVAADYVLITWKDQVQSGANFSGNPIDDACPGADAPAGLSMVRIQGTPGADELWQRTDCPNQGATLTQLASSTNYSATGYVAAGYPTIRVVYTATRIRVFINDVLDMDVQGTFPSTGRYGLYTFAQEGVTFNMLNGSSLTSSCQEICGDGIIVGNEQCDDDNVATGDGCDQLCNTEAGYTCNGQPSVCGSTCGDGIKASDEACDDDNTTPNDGCDATCAIEMGFTCTGSPSVCTPTCGNGSFEIGEQCDDNNNIDGDGCSASCVAEQGYTCVGFPSVCNTNCGDSIITGAEQCDDGNTTNGDGCDNTCATEPDFTCMGNPSVCQSCGDGIIQGTEVCDDNNNTSNDGCDTTCQTEPNYTCPTGGGACQTVELSTPADQALLNIDPSFTGTASNGATVTVIVTDSNGQEVFNTTVIADANGMWGIPAQGLTDGTYTISSSVTTTGGTITDTHQFEIDTAAPSIAISAPANNDITNDNTPTLSGTTEAGTTITLEVVDAQGNVVQTFSPAVDANGEWSIDSAQLPDGDYTLNATSTDDAGNQTSDSVSFTVDVSPPTLALTSPANGTITNDNTPNITGTLSEDATVVVEIKDDQGTVIQTLTPAVDVNGNWSIDATQLPEGNYSVEAQATDAAGNTSSIAGPNSFQIDVTPPPVSISTPADNSVTADTRPAFAGTSDPGSAIVLELKDDQGNVVHTTTVTADAATGAWSIDDLPADLSDGDYTIEATATDLAGNSATTSNGFTVDTTALPLTIDAPTAGDSLSDTTPDVTGTTAPNTTVTLTLTDDQGATIQTLTVTSDAQGSWSTPLNALNDGAYVVTAEVTNQAGTVSTQTTDFSIDTMAPTLTIDGPVDGTKTNDDTPTINGTTEPGVVVEVTITDSNGNVVETLTPTVDGIGGWTIDATQLPEGEYTINATATDGAGNQAAQGPVTLTVDTTAPTLSISTPTMGELIGTRDVDIAGTSEPNQVMIVVEIIDANGVVIDTQTVDADANGDWTLQTQGLANGEYTARAKTSDEAGNDATAEHLFTVDSDEALLSIDAPADDSTVNVVRPPISGTADADASVTIEIKDEQGNVVTTIQPAVDANGNWSVMPDTDLADGVYTIDVTSTRPNGKMASASVDVTVDTVAPTTTITAPTDGMVGSTNQPEITGTSEPGATVDVTITNAAGTVVFTGQVTADDQGNWTVTPDAPLADDQYTISATSTDIAGNGGTPTTSEFTVDTNAPMVTVTSPSNGDTTEDNTPTITGTTEPGATVTIYVDGMEAGQTTADDQGNWSVDITDELDTGEHTIEARTTDDAGNEGSSGELTVTIAQPTAPVIITSPTEGAQVTAPDVTVTGTGEPGEDVTVTIGGETKTTTVDENGDWTVTFDDVPEGNQTIDAKSGDTMAPSINITVVPESASSAFILRGAGCSSTHSSPTSSLWLLGLLGLLLIRRRRRA